MEKNGPTTNQVIPAIVIGYAYRNRLHFNPSECCTYPQHSYT